MYVNILRFNKVEEEGVKKIMYFGVKKDFT